MSKILSAQEIKSLILQYKSKKAPGDDGFVNEKITPLEHNIDLIQFYQDCLEILHLRNKVFNYNEDSKSNEGQS